MLDTTNLTRRRLLKAGGAATAMAVLPGLISAAPATGAPGWWSRDSYTSRIGERFYMRLDDGRHLTLSLTAVDDSPHGGFALRFKPLANVVHGQATRRFKHREMGSTDLFVVPMLAPGTPLTYVVVINRSV